MKAERGEPEAKRAKPLAKEVTAGSDDKAFFEEHGQFLTFLDGMDTANFASYVSMSLARSL